CCLAMMLGAVLGCGDEDAVSPNADSLALPLVYSEWTAATRVESIPGTAATFNTPDLDGCPFISRDGRSLYMASNRAGGLGGIDIWVATRASIDAPWGAPVNVGAPVNSEANDFCPTLASDGERFFFVSNRAGGCGGTDIFVTRRLSSGAFEPPQNLGCDVNSAADEASPFPLVESDIRSVLYFSSARPGGFTPDTARALIGDSDLYVSELRGSTYARPNLVSGANSAADDAQPNVRRDGRELFFFSTRPGTLGAADIYIARRNSVSDGWSEAVNAGPNVNSSAAETRPSLSWDGKTLYFGSTRPGGEGSTDIYITTRQPMAGSNRGAS
ncbi:MAG: TolB family protein, partial [Gemmatimonadaceae bacterium]